ncbi:MAG: alpha/beta hydrolase [bacterium]|nr:alpha/beta hydrolase [bacterium]
MTGPAIVLLHAFPLDHRLWEYQATQLASLGLVVIVPDLPGFGGSALPDAAPSMQVVADIVLAQLDEQGIDRCVLGGVSLGGYVAMAILRQRPELATGVVLCGTKATADGDQARDNRERLAQLVLDNPQDCARILEQAVLPGLLGDTSRSERPEVVAKVRGWLADAPADTVAWYQRAMALRSDSLDVLAGLDVPAVVVWGPEDALSPRAEQDLMVDALVDGRLVLIESAGHLALIERPDAVGNAIANFAG